MISFRVARPSIAKGAQVRCGALRETSLSLSKGCRDQVASYTSP